MAIDKYVTQTYPIKCKGRNEAGEEVLDTAVSVEVKIFMRPESNMISSIIKKCPHNTGAHGQLCKASHPDIDRIGEGVRCPYSFDIPYALETKKIKPSSNFLI
jgi:hypothetical protein